MSMHDRSVANQPPRDAYEYFNRPLRERIAEIDAEMRELMSQSPMRKQRGKWDSAPNAFRFFRFAELVQEMLSDPEVSRSFNKVDAEEILVKCAQSARVEQHGAFSVGASRAAAISFLEDLDAYLKHDEPAEFLRESTAVRDRLVRTATMTAVCIEAERLQR